MNNNQQQDYSTLPPELWLHVLSFLEPPALLSSCLLSRAFYQLSLPILYESVYWSLNAVDGLQQRTECTNSLIRNQRASDRDNRSGASLLSHVKRCTISRRETKYQDSADEWREQRMRSERRMREQQHRGAHSDPTLHPAYLAHMNQLLFEDTLAQTIQHMNNLHSLSLSGIILPSLVVNVLPTLLNLRTLSIRGCRIETQQYIPTQIIVPANIESLTIMFLQTGIAPLRPHPSDNPNVVHPQENHNHLQRDDMLDITRHSPDSQHTLPNFLRSIISPSLKKLTITTYDFVAVSTAYTLALTPERPADSDKEDEEDEEDDESRFLPSVLMDFTLYGAFGQHSTPRIYKFLKRHGQNLERLALVGPSTEGIKELDRMIREPPSNPPRAATGTQLPTPHPPRKKKEKEILPNLRTYKGPSGLVLTLFRGRDLRDVTVRDYVGSPQPNNNNGNGGGLNVNGEARPWMTQIRREDLFPKEYTFLNEHSHSHLIQYNGEEGNWDLDFEYALPVCSGNGSSDVGSLGWLGVQWSEFEEREREVVLLQRQLDRLTRERNRRDEGDDHPHPHHPQHHPHHHPHHGGVVDDNDDDDEDRIPRGQPNFPSFDSDDDEDDDDGGPWDTFHDMPGTQAAIQGPAQTQTQAQGQDPVETRIQQRERILALLQAQRQDENELVQPRVEPRFFNHNRRIFFSDTPTTSSTSYAGRQQEDLVARQEARLRALEMFVARQLYEALHPMLRVLNSTGVGSVLERLEFTVLVFDIDLMEMVVSLLPGLHALEIRCLRNGPDEQFFMSFWGNYLPRLRNLTRLHMYNLALPSLPPSPPSHPVPSTSNSLSFEDQRLSARMIARARPTFEELSMTRAIVWTQARPGDGWGYYVRDRWRDVPGDDPTAPPSPRPSSTRKKKKEEEKPDPKGKGKAKGKGKGKSLPQNADRFSAWRNWQEEDDEDEEMEQDDDNEEEEEERDTRELFEEDEDWVVPGSDEDEDDDGGNDNGQSQIGRRITTGELFQQQLQEQQHQQQQQQLEEQQQAAQVLARQREPSPQLVPNVIDTEMAELPDPFLYEGDLTGLHHPFVPTANQALQQQQHQAMTQYDYEYEALSQSNVSLSSRSVHSSYQSPRISHYSFQSPFVAPSVDAASLSASASISTPASHVMYHHPSFTSLQGQGPSQVHHQPSSSSPAYQFNNNNNNTSSNPYGPSLHDSNYYDAFERMYNMNLDSLFEYDPTTRTGVTGGYETEGSFYDTTLLYGGSQQQQQPQVSLPEGAVVAPSPQQQLNGEENRSIHCVRGDVEEEYGFVELDDEIDVPSFMWN